MTTTMHTGLSLPAPSDPVLRAFLTAPMDNEELTPAELAAIAEGERSMREGPPVYLSDLCKKYGFQA